MHFEGKQIGRYRFERLIGRGAMGEVYLAVDPRILQQVAVKVLQAEMSAYPATNVAREAERFRREASAIANLRHPLIVPLYDYDETSIDESAITYLVIPYYKEGSFASWLRRRGSDFVPMEDVVYFVQQAADALQYAHNHQVIHRDVKPSNFLIETGENPNRPNLLLADFGISKFAMGTTAGGTQSLGTLTYMPPEQLHGRPTYASDQYALAIMTYELLVGHPPFEGPAPVVIRQHLEDLPQPPSMLNPRLPRAIDHVLLRALDKKPENRYPTISEFARALQQALPGTSESPMGRMEQGKETIPSVTSASSSQETLAHLSPAEEKQTTDAAANPQEISAPATSSFHSAPTQAAAMPPTARPLLPTRGSRLNRRMLLFLGSALVILLGGIIGGVAFTHFWFLVPSPPVSQAMFGFDAAHTHNNPYEHTLSPANVSRLQLLWSFATAKYISSSPAVAGGMVYVGSHDKKLYAFDATCRNACQPLWSFATGGDITSSPAVASGMVYVFSDDGKLYAFDATCRKACQPLWSFAGSYGHASPTIADGMVYAASAVFEGTCRKYCRPLGRFEGGSGSPAVAGGLVYVGSWDGKLYAFDATCRSICQPLWSFATGREIRSSPAVAGGLVYVGSDDKKLYAFDATCRRKACQPLWSFATGGYVGSSPAVAGGMVYVGSDDKKLYAFDATCRKACQPLWSFATGGYVESSPTVAGGMVYVASVDHNFYIFDATCRKACQPLWSFYTEGSIFDSSPAVANGMVYIGSYDNELYAFGLVA